LTEFPLITRYRACCAFCAISSSSLSRRFVVQDIIS
jgi:hypothetical protein